MNFLGYDFSGDINSLLPYKSSPSISSITIKNGIYDDVYLSTDPEEADNDIFEWNQNTIIFADFDNKNLSASNFEYSDELYSLQLKRREIDRGDWIMLHEMIIEDTSNMNFTYEDRYASGRNTNYEYALVPVLKDGTELPYIKTTIQSNFDGAVISDATTTYHVLLDPSITSITRNRTASVVTTLNNKYPYVFFGGQSNYESGQFSGTVIYYNGNDTWDFEKSHQYREDMIDWLTNGEAKILKMWDGRTWMISVNGNVNVDSSEHPDKVSLSFEFVEVGDYNNQEDLFANGLSVSQVQNDTQQSYAIVNRLTHVTTSNTATSIEKGGTYTATLSEETDYAITGVVVTMAGVTITNSAYNAETKEIKIENVSGNIIITASATSKRIPVSSITLNKNETTIYVGSITTLIATVLPDNATSKVVTWKSDNSDIASVTEDGVVKGISYGSANIIAFADDVSAVCSVTVRW